MKKIITTVFLLASSFSYADYIARMPLETPNGGSLPADSIIFSTGGSGTPTEPESPQYQSTSGKFGFNGVSGAVITSVNQPTYVDRTTLAYTFTSTSKVVIESVSIEDVSGNGGEFSNPSITYQNCSGSGTYTCVINISAIETSGAVDPENGLGESLTNGFGMVFDIAFTGKYQTN